MTNETEAKPAAIKTRIADYIPNYCRECGAGVDGKPFSSHPETHDKTFDGVLPAVTIPVTFPHCDTCGAELYDKAIAVTMMKNVKEARRQIAESAVK